MSARNGYLLTVFVRPPLAQSHREEVDRIKRDLSFANERAEDATRNKSSEVSGMLGKYNRQLTELEDSLRVSSAVRQFCRLSTSLVVVANSRRGNCRANKCKSTICSANSTPRRARSAE